MARRPARGGLAAGDGTAAAGRGLLLRGQPTRGVAPGLGPDVARGGPRRRVSGGTGRRPPPLRRGDPPERPADRRPAGRRGADAALRPRVPHLPRARRPGAHGRLRQALPGEQPGGVLPLLRGVGAGALSPHSPTPLSPRERGALIYDATRLGPVAALVASRLIAQRPSKVAPSSMTSAGVSIS